jgi:hypothetical protein
MAGKDDPLAPRPSWLIRYSKRLFVLCVFLAVAVLCLAVLAAIDGAWGAVAGILAAGLLLSLGGAAFSLLYPRLKGPFEGEASVQGQSLRFRGELEKGPPADPTETQQQWRLLQEGETTPDQVRRSPRDTESDEG